MPLTDIDKLALAEMAYKSSPDTDITPIVQKMFDDEKESIMSFIYFAVNKLDRKPIFERDGL